MLKMENLSAKEAILIKEFLENKGYDKGEQPLGIFHDGSGLTFRLANCVSDIPYVKEEAAYQDAHSFLAGIRRMSKKRVYQVLAEALRLKQRGEDQSREDWIERADRIIDKIMDQAPHGSGFDNGTKLEGFNKSGQIVLTTAFHHMDQAGGYGSWTDHTVKVKPDFTFGFDLSISGKDRNQIKDYIHECFDMWLNSEVEEIF